MLPSASIAESRFLKTPSGKGNIAPKRKFVFERLTASSQWLLLLLLNMKWINVSSVAYLPHQTFLYSGKEGIAGGRLRANIKIKRLTLSSSTAQYSGQIKFLIANKIGPFRNIQKNAITAKIHQASPKRAQ